MSPECLQGKYYGKQSDIFGLGIIMCELNAQIDADPDILVHPYLLLRILPYCC